MPAVKPARYPTPIADRSATDVRSTDTPTMSASNCMSWSLRVGPPSTSSRSPGAPLARKGSTTSAIWWAIEDRNACERRARNAERKARRRRRGVRVPRRRQQIDARDHIEQDRRVRSVLQIVVPIHERAHRRFEVDAIAKAAQGARMLEETAHLRPGLARRVSGRGFAFEEQPHRPDFISLLAREHRHANRASGDHLKSRCGDQPADRVPHRLHAGVERLCQGPQADLGVG